jgi:hypothetical protein
MSDTVSIAFGVVNSALAFVGLLLTLYGRSYFKQGLMVKTLKRGTIVAIFLFSHFTIEALGDIGFIPPMPMLGYVLEFAFTLGLAYLAYGFIRDWQTLGAD